MFTPTSADVRAFFAEAGESAPGPPLTPLETIAADWIEAHPEYARRPRRCRRRAGGGVSGSGGRENPFLHLSMHLAISEQVQIDQPRGIRAAFEPLAARLGSAHAAQHEIMECLGEMLWHGAAQRPRARRRGLPRLRPPARDG